MNLCGKYVILGVAAIWDWRKGLEDLFTLAGKLNERYQLLVLGVTPTQKKHLPKNIIGIIRTNSIDELRKLYGIADIFVNPTYEDNYPTTNLEAHACGTCVITYRTGGSPESADYIVEKGNIDELCHNIEHLSISRQNNYDISIKHMTYEYRILFDISKHI